MVSVLVSQIPPPPPLDDTDTAVTFRVGLFMLEREPMWRSTRRSSLGIRHLIVR
jgi:hypothetical protein